jgi:hypothetical protein
MHKTELAIATITLARQPDEEAMLLRGLAALAASPLPVFVTDGGSASAFLERARRIDGLTWCEPARGLWPQVRRGLDAAREAGARWILYTEPDKVDFFRENLRTFIAQAPVNEGSGVVLVSRASEQLATFPVFQQYSESVINRCCAEVIGRAFDYSYGPFLLAATVVQHLRPPTEEIGWGWRPFAFGIAHRLGLRIEHVPLAAACPADQRSRSERVYRMQQLAQSVEGLVLSTKVAL